MYPVDESKPSWSSLPVANSSYTCSGVSQSTEAKESTSKVARIVAALTKGVSFFLSTEKSSSGKTVAKSDSYVSRQIMGLFGKAELSLNFKQRLASTSVEELHSLFEDVNRYGGKEQVKNLFDKLNDVSLYLRKEPEEGLVRDQIKERWSLQIAQDIGDLIFKYQQLTGQALVPPSS
jgi:hypothetical protein